MKFPSDNLKEWWLVFSQEQRDSLIQRQDELKLKKHRVAPIPLIDGRWATCADVFWAQDLLYPLVVSEELGGAEIISVGALKELLSRPVNLNADSAETLAERLPGVGQSLADAIVAGRPWAMPADLAAVPGISAAMVEEWEADPGLTTWP